jgi:hypothetical protein
MRPYASIDAEAGYSHFEKKSICCESPFSLNNFQSHLDSKAIFIVLMFKSLNDLGLLECRLFAS